MWSEIKRIALLEGRGLYGWNRFRHTRDRRERRRYLLVAGAVVLLLLLAMGYSAGIAAGLILLGAADAVFAYLCTVVSIVTLVFGIFKSGETIFSRTGYEWLVSLPIRASSVVFARFLLLYLENVICSFVVMVPGIAVYAVMMTPAWWFYPLSLLGILLIPGIPLLFSVAIGVMVTAISVRSKNKALVQSLLSVGLVLAVLALSMIFGSQAESMTMDALELLIKQMRDILAAIYPPAMWLQNALTGGDFLSFLLFAGLALLGSIVTVAIVARFYERICRRLLVTGSGSSGARVGLRRSRRSALLFKEAKRYFSSGVYVSNTIMGPILAIALSVSILVMGTDAIASVFPFPIDIVRLMPFVLSAVLCMMPITSVSVSMEGKEMWISQTLPISTREWLDGKLLLQLLLSAPGYLISEILLCIALRPNVGEAVCLVLIPALLILFSAVAALWIDLRFHRFDWEREVTVVKQSASSGLGGFCGVLFSLVCMGVAVLTPDAWESVACGAICAALTVLTWILYARIDRVKMDHL